MSMFPMTDIPFAGTRAWETYAGGLAAPRELSSVLDASLNPAAGAMALSMMSVGMTSHVLGTWIGLMTGAAQSSQRLLASGFVQATGAAPREAAAPAPAARPAPTLVARAAEMVQAATATPAKPASKAETAASTLVARAAGKADAAAVEAAAPAAKPAPVVAFKRPAEPAKPVGKVARTAERVVKPAEPAAKVTKPAKSEEKAVTAAQPEDQAAVSVKFRGAAASPSKPDTAKPIAPIAADEAEKAVEKNVTAAAQPATIAAQPSAEIMPEDFRAPKKMDKPERPDDLKAIAGIGPKLEKVLNGLGVWTYGQIAALSREEIAWLDDYLSFKGRIERDGWLAQAARLAGSPKG